MSALPHLPVASLEDATADFEFLAPLLLGAGRVTEAMLVKAVAEKLLAPTGLTKQTRVLGTAYQPSTTRTTFVLATIRGEASAGSAEAKVKTDAANPPTTEVAKALVNNSGGTTNIMEIPITFPVLAGDYYKIEKVAGTISLTSVYESVL